MEGEPFDRRYNLLEELERGSFLVHYLARDTVSGLDVEIDAIDPERSLSPHLAARLPEVLERAKAISGPGIASLLGWGEENGRIYMVRERFEGVSLAEVLTEVGELPVEQVREITAAAIEAMAEAYGKGLFYLGLNPLQVLMNWRGEVRVVRVGYGWLLEEMEPILAARVSPYRAPETDGGREGTRTSDVYSLAVMIRQMLPRGKGDQRLDSLLDKSVNPLPKHRPTSPRLLLEALDGAWGKMSVKSLSPPAPPFPCKDQSSSTESGRKSPGGLRFLRGEDGFDDFPPPGKRKGSRPFKFLSLILLAGIAVWLLFAAVTGSLNAGSKGGEKADLSAQAASKVTLPDLQGLPLEEARDVLEELGLQVTSREAPSNLWSAGVVAAQEPQEGSALEAGETVYLVVSSGREEARVEERAQAGEAAGSSTQESSAATPGVTPDGESGPAAGREAQRATAPSPDFHAPRAVAKLSSRSGPSPLLVVMDASGSRDTGGDIVRYVWDCGDGTVLEGMRVQHVYDPPVTPARFGVVLRVFDATGMSDSCAASLEVY